MSHDPDDIAIVGMACTVPGAGDLETYWQNILAKVDAVGDPPPEWGAQRYLDSQADANNRIYCARGGYLGPLAEFDPIACGIMPNSVDGGEPDHFLALRLADAALADAGYKDNPPPRDRVEVIIGRGSYVNRGNTTAIQHGIIVDRFIEILKQLHPEHGDTELERIRTALTSSLPPFNAETAAALVPNVITGRIANRLDFMGSNFIVDAACASSLMAVDIGIQDLRKGRCDLALVGGVHASTPPVIVMIFCQLKAISRDGQIRPFDRRADGTLLGEGGGMIVLKRRRDAERDGNRIYAVLKGVGVASDGRALGLLAPRLEGEELAIRRAYEDSNVTPESVGLIEAHGTATVVGDVTEVEALRRVFATGEGDERKRIGLGSVKSMISHLMPASGIAGLIKTALALHHRVLPPTIHCEEPNPELNLDEGPLYLNTEPRPWIHGRRDVPRRAAVNAFGFGGINAHVILEEAAGEGEIDLASKWDSELFLLSATDREGLMAALARLSERIDARADLSLPELACAVNLREHGPARLAIVAESIADLKTKLETVASKLDNAKTRAIRDRKGIYYSARPLAAEGGLAFLFPGEGSQYPNMLVDLCLHFPEVRGFFDLMDRSFSGHERGYLPSDFIFPVAGGAGGSQLWSMDAGAEAVFAANQALVALLLALGIRPDAVVGHSTGEHSALLTSGALQVADDDELINHILEVNAIYARSEARGEIPEAALVAVGGVDRAGIQTVVDAGAGELLVAMDNCPHQAVLCGKEEAMAAAVGALEPKGAICQRLSFGRPYHTPWFEFFCEPMRAHFGRVRIAKPRIPLYSCVTADRFPDDADGIRDLAAQQWARTVRFRETVEAMYEDGIRLFVEVGPRANLTSFVSDTLRGKSFLAAASNAQALSGMRQLNLLLAQLFANGVELRPERLYDRRGIKPENLDLDAPKAGRPPLRIRTELQPLSLPTDFVLAPAAGADAGQPSSERQLASVSATPPDDMAPASPPAVGPAPIPVSAPSPVQPAASKAVMGRHLETMQEFLKLQSQVMEMYLASPRRADGMPAPSPTGAQTHGVGSGQAVQASRGPMIGEILELVPNGRVRMRKRLSLETEPLLMDHTLGRDLSDTDPELTGMPVLPFTGTMELLAETGALLFPAKVLTRMHEVRAYRWITVEEPVELEVVGELRDDGGVGLRVQEVRGGEPVGPVLAETIAFYADTYPETPPVPALDGIGVGASDWKPEELYRRGMFHGPAFRMVASMDRVGPEGAVATLTVPPRDSLFTAFPEPFLSSDLVLLDGPGQVVAFWIMEHCSTGTDVFPFRLGRIDLFGPPLPAGERLLCQAKTELQGDDRTTSDIWVTDARGRLWCRFRQWDDRRFELPHAWIALRSAPREVLLASDWPDALPDDAGPQAVCMSLGGYDPQLFEASAGIWAKMLAYLLLGRRERLEWQRLACATPKRRREWLLGRCAAKDAVRALVKRLKGVALPPADVEILPDQRGRPVVDGAWRQRLGLSPVVSIAHSHERAVALAAPSDSWLLGIDIEAEQELPAGFDALAFEPEVRRLLETLPAVRRSEWRMRLWCAKESALKACGPAGDSPGQGFRITQADIETGEVIIAVDSQIRTERPGLEGQRLRARTFQDKDFFASVILKQTQSG